MLAEWGRQLLARCPLELGEGIPLQRGPWSGAGSPDRGPMEHDSCRSAEQKEIECRPFHLCVPLVVVVVVRWMRSVMCVLLSFRSFVCEFACANVCVFECLSV